MQADVILIGAAVLDILTGPVDETEGFPKTHEVKSIRMSTGGDAMNESVILSRLGKKAHLICRVGDDAAGRFILEQCRAEGISTKDVRQIKGLDTSVNLVLVEKAGERRFVVASDTSLRKQTPEDVDFRRLPGGKILMFASIFVSPPYTVKEMARVFREAREAGYLVAADMTKRKNGETLADLAPALQYVDFLFPNLEEAALLSGLDDPEEITNAFLEAGVGTIVLKLGARGCLICSRTERIEIPAVPGVMALDTTGAGDTFAAAFLCGLLEGRTLTQCGQFANAAASVTVETLGATTGLKCREQIEERLKAYSTGYTPNE